MTLISDLRDRFRVRRDDEQPLSMSQTARDDVDGMGLDDVDARTASTDTHHGMPSLDDDLEEPTALSPSDASRIARSSVAVEPKNQKQRIEAARALGRLLSGLEDHQRHQTKVLRYLEPIPELSSAATELRRDAARMLEAAGDSREHARTVERRVEAGLAALGERQTALEASLARVQHDVDALGRAVREMAESSEHARAGLSMVHDRTERLNEVVARMERHVQEDATARREGTVRQNRILIGAGVVLAIIGILGMVI